MNCPMAFVFPFHAPVELVSRWDAMEKQIPINGDILHLMDLSTYLPPLLQAYFHGNRPA